MDIERRESIRWPKMVELGLVITDRIAGSVRGRRKKEGGAGRRKGREVPLQHPRGMVLMRDEEGDREGE
jgi:hypothetical protein